MANLATLPPPHGSPHPTTHLTTYLYVFCVQRAQKPCLMIKIQLLLHFSKVGGGKSILAFFGLWWPSFSATGSPGVAQKCQTRVSPCYTYGNPCQNICRACSINFMQFLNTPTMETWMRNFKVRIWIYYLAHMFITSLIKQYLHLK